ncbi:MAG: type II toxin-antitoxin system HicB family antitoxin [Candidatus Devosia phytovorans]|uniref:Type II toxin-antitoxin system HicB family antitoxin n=1 Tax=Candidatus Devosia phytovorans TaxID=3121372 RepID=A0AAJ5VUB8_9HYPH|nr:type II toxin-antitoxin system HicB family antitoxin [Devosia sp.]WEK04991.1 MAG: type II toxin-antitoxin system HicB family antitoxin [Devosia sp.]
MTSYYATFEPDEDGVLVTFPDVPEAISGGVDRAEAMTNAQDALEVALLTYVGDGKALPIAKAKQGVLVSLSASTAVKIAFIEAFRSSQLTRVALAERLGKQEGEVRRMLDPYHATKLPAMEAGLQALGKQLVVSVHNAA